METGGRNEVTRTIAAAQGTVVTISSRFLVAVSIGRPIAIHWGHRAKRTLFEHIGGSHQNILIFLRQFHFSLCMRIVQCKIAHNDRDRKREHQEATHCACAPNDVTGHRPWHYVTVTQRCHGLHSPVKTDWNVRKVVLAILLNLLREINQHTKYQDPDYEDQEQQEQLLGTGSDGVPKNFQTTKVTCQFKDSENSNETQSIYENSSICGQEIWGYTFSDN